MKHIKNLKKWGIYQNNAKEVKEYGFNITVLHPNNMECIADSGMIFSPSDSDMEMNTVESAEHWINHYND
jgi:hypothetical protein